MSQERFNFHNYPKLTNIVIGQNITVIGKSLANAFSGMENLQTFSIPESVNDISNIAAGCINLTNAFCGKNVIDMSNAYRNCINVKEIAVNDIVTNMCGSYADSGVSGETKCPDTVIDFSETYRNTNINSLKCGPAVTNMSYTFAGCKNLNIGTEAICGTQVTDMSGSYEDSNIEGTAVCGNNVKNFSNAYSNTKINIAVCPDSVEDFSYTYHNTLINTPVCGAGVKKMSGTYKDCPNLEGIAVCSSETEDLSQAYMNTNISTAVCKEKVTNISGTYAYTNVTEAIFGPSVEDASRAYETCNISELTIYHNINGEITCYKNIVDENGEEKQVKINTFPNSVTNISNTFAVYRKGELLRPFFGLNGEAPYGDGIINMSHAFYNATGLTKATCGIRVQDMNGAYEKCIGLNCPAAVGAAVTNMSNAYKESGVTTAGCTSTVIDMSGAFYKCSELKGQPFTGNSVLNMSNAYAECSLLTGSPAVGPDVTDISNVYRNCSGLTGSPICPDTVTNMSGAYADCSALNGTINISSEAIDMSEAYLNCKEVTGSPKSGKNVTNMYKAFCRCRKIGNSPKCGNNVTNLSYAYYLCSNLTGYPNCGPNVINMSYAYFGCTKLDTFFDIGRNVKDMSYAYAYCDKISLYSQIPPSVTNIAGSFYGCYNFQGNPGMFENITNASYAFCGCNLINGSPNCGKGVIDFSGTYSGCSNLTGKAACGENVTNMSHTYEDCSLITSPACGEKVINMSGAYMNCSSLSSSTCGSNVIDMSNAYYNCYKMIGSPAVGNNVINMSYAYYNCTNLPLATCSSKTKNMSYAYYNCTNITSISLSSSITNLSHTFYNCGTISIGKIPALNNETLESTVNCFYNCDITGCTGSPICGKEDISLCYNYTYENGTAYTKGVYENCTKLVGPPIYGDNVINMSRTYANCYNLTGTPICSDKIEDLSYTYYNCYNLTGSPVCGKNVVNMSRAYFYCIKLTGSPVCGDNVQDLSGAYMYCDLEGKPVCGEKVTSMSYTYYKCYNLTGSPVCSKKVVDMDYVYGNCTNLTGHPVCEENVQDFHGAYDYCYRLTGRPICGPNVTEMSYTYNDCRNLIGPAILGAKTTQAQNTYANCFNLSSNAYFYNSFTTFTNCFLNWPNTKRLNIYLPQNSRTFNNAISSSIFNSMFGKSLTWTKQADGSYKNAAYPYYIYPISNIENKYIENEFNEVIPVQANLYINSQNNLHSIQNNYSIKFNSLSIDEGYLGKTTFPIQNFTKIESLNNFSLENYSYSPNTLEELFSEDITQEENKIIIQENENTIVPIESWFNFNNESSIKLYIDSNNSIIGFNSLDNYLKLSPTTDQTIKITNLYKKEGVFNQLYRFIKLKFTGEQKEPGLTYYLEFDIVLWETGDISFYRVEDLSGTTLTLQLKNNSSLLEDSTVIEKDNITFIKSESDFTQNKALIELPEYNIRYLFRTASSSKYLTFIGNRWSQIDISELTSEIFLKSGVSEIPSFSDISEMENLEIFCWSELETASMRTLHFTGEPSVPQILYTQPRTIPENGILQYINAFQYKNVIFTISFDEGQTWNYYKINEGWCQASDILEGMTASTLNSLCVEEWNSIITSNIYQIRIVFPSLDSKIGRIAVKDDEFFNFNIEGICYTAKQGMTWTDWCASDYNTGGFYAPDYVRFSGASKGVVTITNELVLPSDLIMINYNYGKSTFTLEPI